MYDACVWLEKKTLEPYDDTAKPYKFKGKYSFSFKIGRNIDIHVIYERIALQNVFM